MSEAGQLPVAVAVAEQRGPDRERKREVRVEHSYPQAQRFLVAHGHQGVAVLHALLQDATFDDEVLVASVAAAPSQPARSWFTSSAARNAANRR